VAKDAGLPGIDLQTICRSRAKALGRLWATDQKVGSYTPAV
jgi:hypothetical protein